MDEDKLYEEDYLESPERRKFLGDAIIIGSSTLLASLGLTTACKSPTSSDIDDLFKPATEAEGRSAMKEAANTVMSEKSYNYEIKEDINLYTDRQGKFDVVVEVDRNKDGQYDLVLGMNYIDPDKETRQNLSDTATYKFKEIVKSDITTKEYLTEEFKEWMRNVA